MRKRRSRLQTSRRLLWIAAGAIIVVALVAGLERWISGIGPQPGAAQAIGGPFSLIDQEGRRVTDREFRGKWMLVYFGYTRCPDACPTTLNEVAGALEKLGPLADRLQPLFITVDPARDTAAELTSYTKAFDTRILGLTGSPAEIAQAATAYRITFARHEMPQVSDYAMDHTSVLTLLDASGRFVIRFGDQIGQDRLAEKLRAFLEKG